jgi:hypothetical protein
MYNNEESIALSSEELVRSSFVVSRMGKVNPDLLGMISLKIKNKKSDFMKLVQAVSHNTELNYVVIT